VSDVEDRLTVPSNIESAYLVTVHQTAEALKYIHSPTGQVKLRVLAFSIPFYELYQHTHHIPAVAEVIRNDATKRDDLDGWFYSTKYSPEALKRGIALFSWYQKILLESRVITIEKQ